MPKLTGQQLEQRRGRILNAAEACFARAGFHRTTMQEICREAGISAGAFYVYFESKEALIEGLSTREREKVIAAFQTLTESADFGAAMEQVLQDTVIGKPRSEICLYLEMGSEATRNPAVAATMQRCDGMILSALRDLLERARAQGRIDPLMPVDQIVQMLAIVADGMFWRRALDPAFDARAIGQTILSMVGDLVRPVPLTDAPEGKSGKPAGRIGQIKQLETRA